MRDPDRIFRILDLIEGVWYKDKDLRLGQLLGNALMIAEKTYVDPFEVEDDDIEEALKI